MNSSRSRPADGTPATVHARSMRAGVLCRLHLCAAVLCAATCGCRLNSEDDAMAKAYYLNPHKDLRQLGRVALVEPDNMSAYPEIPTDVTRALFIALQKKQVFSLTTVPHDDPAWQGLQQNLDSLQALRGLLAMRDTLGCNGLLVGTITEYRPYPQLTLGLRFKLLDLTDGQLLWGIEQVWDAGDKSTQKRVEAYFKENLSSDFAPLREDLVLISSREFVKFAAFETADTLDRSRE